MARAGDLDLVVGRTDSFLSELYYLENTGTSTASAFVQRTGSANPFHSMLTMADDGNAAPALGDLDNDGTLRLCP